MGFVSNAFDAVGDVLGGAADFVGSALDKIIPNEIKPILPFAAAAFPFLAPELFAGLGSLGGMVDNPILQRMIAGGITNLGSQASQEGFDKRGLNPLSFGLSTLGGALTAPSESFGALKSYTPGDLWSASSIPGGGIEGGLFPQGYQNYGTDYLGLTNPSLATTDTLQNIQNAILSGAEKSSDFFNRGVEGFQNDGLFNKDFLKAYAIPAAGAAGDLAWNAAMDQKLAYQDQVAELARRSYASKQEQMDYIRSAMRKADFTESEIEDALKRSGFAKGGRARYEKGGLMSLKGREMDFRDGGGFVPLGKKERADDVPARLSKNEFVFTAKAVRNAGNGSTKEGAKRMYQLMKQLEARA